MKKEVDNYFAEMNEGNKNAFSVPRQSNRVVFSCLRNIDFSNAMRNFSIKYSIDGTEYYKIRNREYRLDKGHFIVSPACSDSAGYFDSVEPLRGICIDIDPRTISQAANLFASGNAGDPDRLIENYFEAPFMLEQLYRADVHPLGKVLLAIQLKLEQGHDPDFIDEEWFLALAQEVVTSEFRNLEGISSLNYKRYDTKKEVYRRLLTGKSYLEDNIRECYRIKDAANAACLSEFHFFRAFRQAFGISPHKYAIRLKLENSHRDLSSGGSSVTEVAFRYNFPDVQSFSKSFRKHFGYSPSRLP